MSDGFWACIVILVVIIATLEILGPDEISRPSCPTEQNIHCTDVHMAILDSHFPCDQIDELKYNMTVFTARCTDGFEYRAMLLEGVYRVSEKRDQL